MKLLTIIVPRSASNRASKIIGSKKLDFQITVPAEGTAPNEILEYLNLGVLEKDVIFSIVDDEDIPLLFEELKRGLNLSKEGNGVAFTVPLDGTSKLCYQYLYHQPEIMEGR